ncbi:hypothetical protein [Tistrella mobilis]|uniref:hypothetical protein n=1 Tax=Tistrella mobilis TaxID=171437 RepID=UPI0035586CC8|tara:strand:- start:123 stop:317 length:195 start_codon:yes stop_codon:yes gene_type:complete
MAERPVENQWKLEAGHMQDLDMQKTAPRTTDDDRKLWSRPVLGMLALDETAENADAAPDISGLS